MDSERLALVRFHVEQCALKSVRRRDPKAWINIQQMRTNFGASGGFLSSKLSSTLCGHFAETPQTFDETSRQCQLWNFMLSWVKALVWYISAIQQSQSSVYLQR